MKVNFYLDKPYNPDISPEKVKQELAKVGGKKKNLAQKFWNPSPTALYLFFSPDKSCRIKYRTNYKILPKSWDFEKERLKPSASGALEFNVELNNLANCCTREAMRKTSFFPKRIINRLYRTVLTGTMPSIVKYPFPT
jgi:hypothetical protein